MFQLAIIPTLNQKDANEKLRIFQRDFPKREIINISMEPVEWPGGWFMTIVYKIKM